MFPNIDDPTVPQPTELWTLGYVDGNGISIAMKYTAAQTTQMYIDQTILEDNGEDVSLTLEYVRG